MKIDKVVLIAVLSVLMVACASSNLTFSSEKAMDKGYDVYKTYAFLPTTDTSYAKLIDRQKLIPLLTSEGMNALTKKGLKLDTANPDCLFTYRLVVKRAYAADQQQETVYNAQVMNVASVPMYNMYGPGISGSASGVSGSATMRAGTGPGSQVYYFSSDNRPYTYDGKITIDTLREGSMVIDMIDAKTRKIIWRSVALDKKSESAIPSLEETVNHIIPAMLSKVPRK